MKELYLREAEEHEVKELYLEWITCKMSNNVIIDLNDFKITYEFPSLIKFKPNFITGAF